MTALNNITQVTFCHFDLALHLPVMIVILQVDSGAINNKPECFLKCTQRTFYNNKKKKKNRLRT